LHDVTAIAAGGFHNLALTRAGKVVAWGANYYRQTQVPAAATGVTALAAAGDHNLALTGDGRVFVWGHNGNGEGTLPPG
jgi:alpha-tubulin suppressor-like RCC1 family protein